MLKISDAVKKLLERDCVAREALQQGIMNNSAYAKLIQDEVEELTKKKVGYTSIVMALSRIEEENNELSKIIPDLHLEDMSVKSPLFALTLEKTDENLKKVAKLREGVEGVYDFLTITQGVSELTVIYSDDLGKEVDKKLRFNEKAFYDGLSAVTVSFPDEYINLPNVIYGIVTKLAVRRINLIEVISTFSELTVIIRREDVDDALEALKELLR